MVGHNRASRPPPRGVVASLLRPRDELRAGQPEVFGPVASVPTAFRVVDAIDDELLAGNRAARARVRRVVWAAGLNPVTEHRLRDPQGLPAPRLLPEAGGCPTRDRGAHSRLLEHRPRRRPRPERSGTRSLHNAPYHGVKVNGLQ